MKLINYYLCIFLLLVPVISFAGETAEKAAMSYGAYVAQENWVKAVSYFSETDLQKIRNGFSFVLSTEEVKSALFPEMSFEEIKKLSNIEFAASIFGSIFRIQRERGVLIQMKMPVALGEVKENPSLVHVVYRQNGVVNGAPVSVVDIISVSQYSGLWYVELPEEFESMINAN